MIVRLDLEDRVRQFASRAIIDAHRTCGVIAVRIKARHDAAFEDGRVITVGDDGALRRRPMRRADHVEERRILALAIDGPRGVENLVSAVLRVGLRKHHQLDVGRITSHLRECVEQIFDLVG